MYLGWNSCHSNTHSQRETPAPASTGLGHDQPRLEADVAHYSKSAFTDPTFDSVNATTPMCCWPECRDAQHEAIDLPLCKDHFATVAGGVERNMDALRYWLTGSSPATPAAAKMAERTPHVYAVKMGNRVKIGYSSNVESRLLAIPHEERLAIIPGAPIDERRLHAKFAKYRTNGEWFEAAPEVLEYFAQFA